MPKIFSRKATQLSTFSGPHNIPLSKYKSAPYHHQVVSGVKKNNANNFLFKGYPLKHILKGKLWSFLQKPKFTGALGDYRSTGRWFGTMISMAMYQLIGSWIHLEFLESDVPFSKTYKSL